MINRNSCIAKKRTNKLTNNNYKKKLIASYSNLFETNKLCYFIKYLFQY